jgi:Na+/H+-translocating membrane pyrophosphatase
MKIAIKYGLSITLVVVLWVLVTHFLFPLAPESKANILGPILFNLVAIVAIYLGIKASATHGELNFKQGVKTGVAISLVYGISSCLFFFIVFLFVGPRLMANEPMARNYPMWQVALPAYAGMFFGALILGLMYSTVISFMLVRARKV